MLRHKQKYQYDNSKEHNHFCITKVHNELDLETSIDGVTNMTMKKKIRTLTNPLVMYIHPTDSWKDYEDSMVKHNNHIHIIENINHYSNKS